MAQLMLHRDILKRFAKLPPKVQKRVAELVERLETDPNDPAFRLHPVKESMLDKKVRGAELPDGYRAIIIAPEKGETYLLVHIDKHDEAYDWARNKRFEVNVMTGIFQVFDLEEVREAAADQPAPVPAGGPTHPVATLSEADLRTAGVPEPLIPAVKGICSDAGFVELERNLPRDCRDVLYGVAAGLSLDDALAEMLGLNEEGGQTTLPEGPGDFSGLDKAPSFDLVLVKGEEALRAVLEASLEEWRVFLHPYQRKLVQWDVKGPMNVSGAAGTGKTVVLMHRAVHLARQLQQSRDRVLVTTFTTNLSVTIRELIRGLDPKAFERIEVTNLHALARTICARSGWKGRIATEEEVADAWHHVCETSGADGLPFDRDELWREYQFVVDANGIADLDDYLTTVRSGRPRLTRPQRRQLWPVFLAFRRELKKRSLLTFEGAIHEARLSVEAGNGPRYAHVLVDEVQDFSLEALRLIRALSPVEEGARNPLCTVGDGHQRIHRARVPLGRAGIEIRGRSRRLKVNYRTSEQIRLYAQALLKGEDIDDLDGGSTTTAGDHSVFTGPEPIVERCASEAEEAEAVAAWVKTLVEDSHIETHAICVTYSSTPNPDMAPALAAAGLPVYHLKPRQEDPGAEEPGIRMGTMKRIKGLEFRAVAIADHAAATAVPDEPTTALMHRCERYVAATRAREHLLVTLPEQDS